MNQPPRGETFWCEDCDEVWSPEQPPACCPHCDSENIFDASTSQFMWRYLDVVYDVRYEDE